MLSAIDVRKAYAGATVLGGVSVSVGPDTRLGIVGRNGAGKTTLLRVLAGVEPVDSGRIERAPRSLTVGYLPQEVEVWPGETVNDYLARRVGLRVASDVLDAATATLESDPTALDPYTEALERFLALGGDDFDARAAQVCEHVGLPESRLHLDATALSGGQASRVALAAILLARFDVLLLDEPTNNLDFDGLDVLEEFVQRRSGGLAVVSHDRHFLDAVCTRVLELHEEHRTATEYAGGWSDYVESRTLSRSQQYAAHQRWQAERTRLQTRVQGQREWAAKGAKKAKKSGERDKFIRQHNQAQTEKLVSKVRISEKALARLDRERVDKPWEGWELRLSLDSGGRAGDIVVGLDGAVVERGAFRLGPVTLEVGWGDRLAIVGPNGGGKTTLIGALTGALALTAGVRRAGPATVFGAMDQLRLGIDPMMALVDGFVAETGMLPGEARTLLAKFSLGADHVTRAVGALSPGERSRALMAALMARGVNTLVLDEPTNHLDLEAIEQLESALETFDGSLLLVTHDRVFLDAVHVTRVIEVDEGAVTERT